MNHKKEPVVSVVMSVLNGLPYLAEAVESILSQTFTDFEFIVIDDGSTDETWNVLSDYALRDPRLILLRNEKNSGVASSLNAGIERARGKYIARQDADDISPPTRLERQVAYFESHPSVGLLGTYPQFIGSAGEPLQISNFTLLSDNHRIQQELLNQNCILGGAVLIRRECLDKVGLYDQELAPSEDYDLWLRLGEVTQIANLEEPLYQYRQHPASASSTRRYTQMHHKTIALERAIYRRYGPKPSQDKFYCVARDYLRTSILGYLAHDLPGAKQFLSLALKFNPALFSTPEFEEAVRRYTPTESVEEALQYTETIFTDLFPRSKKLARIKSRLLSELHMRAVYLAMEQKQRDRVNKHLWSGIRHNPGRLFNRGVIAILFGQTIGLNRFQ